MTMEVNRVVLDLGFDDPEEFIAYAVLGVAVLAGLGMLLFMLFRRK